jgi:hypothetical protein
VEFFTYPSTAPAMVAEPAWGVRIDGTDLRVLAADATRGLWLREHPERSEAEREEFLAAQYDGLPDAEIGDAGRHFLGRPGPPFAGFGDGTVPVLGCSCGVWECWVLLADVAAGAATVTWSSFLQPRRPAWGPLPMGPFTFARRAYEAALAAPVRLGADPLA